MKELRLFAGTVLISALLAGCESSAEPDSEVVRMGALFDAAVSIPDIATAGVPFEAVVTTMGNGCLLGADRAEVDTLSGRVEITPFDRWVAPRPNLACTDEQVTVEHVVELVLTEVGEHLVIVRGVRSSWPNDADTTTIEVRITVVD